MNQLLQATPILHGILHFFPPSVSAEAIIDRVSSALSAIESSFPIVSVLFVYRDDTAVNISHICGKCSEICLLAILLEDNSLQICPHRRARRNIKLLGSPSELSRRCACNLSIDYPFNNFTRPVRSMIPNNRQSRRIGSRGKIVHNLLQLGITI
jgi:hypothetical protein